MLRDRGLMHEVGAMRSVFAIQMEIRPRDGESSTECLCRLRDTVTSWITERLTSKWGAVSPQVRFDGVTQEPIHGHQVKAISDNHQDAEIAEVTWVHPHDGGSKWIAHCTMARSGENIAFAMHLRLQSNDFDLRPLTFQLGRPTVVDTIVQNFRCFVTGIPVQVMARAIDDDDVDDLVSDLLRATRHTPVIVVSVDGHTERPIANPDEIQRSVLGFASVVSLKDKWSGFRLTDSLGKALSCYNGAVRLYWPGLTLNSDPFDHPLFLPSQLTAQSRSIGQVLFRFLNSIANFRFREGKPIAEARSIVEARRAQELEEIRKAVAQGALGTKEIQDALERSWDEEKRLRYEIDERDIKISELTDQLEAQKQVWAAMRHEAESANRSSKHVETEPTTGFETVSEALAAAHRDFCGSGKPLVILDRAVKTAADSPYKQPDNVYELLKALHDIAAKWKKNNGALGQDGWQGALEQAGFIYKPAISQTTRTKWGDEYTFKYNGDKYLFEEHVTLGGGDPNTCASIHWILDKKSWTLIVGHCGRHLPNTRT